MGVVAFIVVLIISWNLVDIFWLLKAIISLPIACISAGIVAGIFTNMFDAPGLSSEEKEEFHRICGFPIDSYNKKQLYKIIELLESGQADSFKEATNIIRTMTQHEQLLSGNQNMQRQLERQTKELKKIKQENKEIKSEMEWHNYWDK